MDTKTQEKLLDLGKKEKSLIDYRDFCHWVTARYTSVIENHTLCFIGGIHFFDAHTFVQDDAELLLTKLYQFAQQNDFYKLLCVERMSSYYLAQGIEKNNDEFEQCIKFAKLLIMKNKDNALRKYVPFNQVAARINELFAEYALKNGRTNEAISAYEEACYILKLCTDDLNKALIQRIEANLEKKIGSGTASQC